jgi:hypothetical protein
MSQVATAVRLLERLPIMCGLVIIDLDRDAELASSGITPAVA